MTLHDMDVLPRCVNLNNKERDLLKERKQTDEQRICNRESWTLRKARKVWIIGEGVRLDQYWQFELCLKRQCSTGQTAQEEKCYIIKTALNSSFVFLDTVYKKTKFYRGFWTHLSSEALSAGHFTLRASWAGRTHGNSSTFRWLSVKCLHCPPSAFHFMVPQTLCTDSLATLLPSNTTCALSKLIWLQAYVRSKLWGWDKRLCTR